MARVNTATLPRQTSGNLGTALTIAGAALGEVAAGHALDDSLRAAPGAGGTPADRAAAQDIAYTACRQLNLLDALAGQLLAKANPAIDGLVRAALSELIAHPERAHTIVDQAVTASADLKRGAFKGVINAVLRRFLRERDALLEQARKDEAVRLTYPAWWITRVRNAYPRDWEAILAAGNGRPAMTLRVNLRATSLAQYAATLQAAGLAHTQTGPQALCLDKPMPVARLPGYAEGLVSVQDLGAQCAAPLLDVHDGMRVLDACAAPGGKTAHLLEAAACAVTALDRDAQRLQSVADNLARLCLNTAPGLQLTAADAADLPAWWDGVPYDRVLLDAPCTASGIVRRHPDGKWLKRASDIKNLAGEQQRLLNALWQVLRPGGKLLYATCSIFPEENARHIGAFLSTHAEARLLAPDLPLDHRDGQLLPKEQHDGFFYALLEKT